MLVRGIAGFVLGLVLVSGARASDPGPLPPDAVLADLPFVRPEEANRIYVDLAAEGARPFPLQLDTGASTSVLSPRLARDLGVSVRGVKRSAYRRETRLGRDLEFYVDTRSSDTASTIRAGGSGCTRDRTPRTPSVDCPGPPCVPRA